MDLDLFGFMSQFFDPIFLVLATVFGYFTFLLYFYGTKHWRNTEWGDRILISIIMGLTFFFFFVSWIPIIVSIWMRLMRNVTLSGSLTYSISTFVFLLLMLFLVFFRWGLGEPLHSTAAEEFWKGFFAKCKLVHLVKFDLFWLFFVAFVTSQYPLSAFLPQRWLDISIAIVFGSFFLYFVLPLTLSNLTYMPNLRSDMFSAFLKDLRKVNIKKISKHLIHVVILFLVALSITSFDSQIGLFTPKIALIESMNLVGDTVYLSRYEDMKTVAMTYNEMTIHIVPPLIPSVSINFLKITNPSNSTPIVRGYETKITSDDGLDCRLSSDERTLNVTIKKERNDLSVKIKYYNQLSVDSVVRIEEAKDIPVTTLPNGTKIKDYYFKITNLTPQDLYLKSVALLYLGNYNMTAFSYDVEWEPEAKGFCDVYNTTSWSYLHGNVGPKVSLAIRIKILYEER